MQFGGLVRVPAAGAEVFGLINNLRTDTGPDGRERRLFDIELLGETVQDSRFERGGFDLSDPGRADLCRDRRRPRQYRRPLGGE